ncbi:polysaccharide lyase family 7 protein [Paraglaciecola arctica]|uniref:polysaccharide lyase family 7 protein n=1 Tax=Paraglaciecola arctica TaxID=1128911 RepID=UPI00209175FD|nr:polysaccharide lyase family 7 protein [Paraglaciecola arctica]
MTQFHIKKIMQSSIIFSSCALLLAACSGFENGTTVSSPQSNKAIVPATEFDLSHWKITVPVDLDNNGKIDEVGVSDIQNYAHPDFFYLDENRGMVFAAPNKAITTATSTNTRSELRQMLRGANKKIKTQYAGNNFAIAAHPLSERFAAVGGKMQATLKVDHVALRANLPNTPAAYSVVVGQIHALKDKDLMAKNLGFGWGNEPIKIYFKKWPNHERGSVFWNYERNLPKDDPNRTDITYPVWGNTWENSSEPGDSGIALGEEFSYTINLHQNTMYLTFDAENKKQVTYSINLANNLDAYGEIDKYDPPLGYTADSMYFKAGAYNQCSTKEVADTTWYAGCLGTGDWEIDKQNGDYTQVTFSRLVLSPSHAPKN